MIGIKWGCGLQSGFQCLFCHVHTKASQSEVNRQTSCPLAWALKYEKMTTWWKGSFMVLRAGKRQFGSSRRVSSKCLTAKCTDNNVSYIFCSSLLGYLNCITHKSCCNIALVILFVYNSSFNLKLISWHLQKLLINGLKATILLLCKLNFRYT